MAKKNEKHVQEKKLIQTFHDDAPQSTGERLKLWRKIRGYTQQQFVEITDCWTDTTTYSRIENGNTRLTEQNAEICASVLGVTKEYLLCQDENATFLHGIYDNAVDFITEKIDRDNELIIEGKILELLGVKWDMPVIKDNKFVSADLHFDDGSSFRINDRQNDFIHVLVHDSLVSLYDTLHNYCVTSTKVIKTPKGSDKGK